MVQAATQTAAGTTGTDKLEDPHGLLDVFGKAEDMPTLPEVSIHLMKVIDDPGSSAKDAARIIEEDPAIAAKVLKMCNSALYAPINTREINSLQLAISRMGFVAVANIAISTSVFEAFDASDRPAFDRYEFWRHSVCVGIVADLLYDRIRDRLGRSYQRETVHLAGIVHDIGKILFERYANKQFHQAVLNAQDQQDSLVVVEQAALGLGHDQAGAWLADRWRLSEDITQVILCHHDPVSCQEEDFSPLVKLIHVADYVCHKLALGTSGNPAPGCDRRVIQDLGVSGEMIRSLSEPIRQAMKDSQVLLALSRKSS